MKKLAILSVLLFVISCQNYGDKLTFNGTEVYYKNGVTKAQATQLGEFLIKEEFADGETKSVQFLIDEKTKNLTFRMVADEKVINTLSDFVFTTFSRDLSNEFKRPVDFQTCDNTFKTLKTYYNKDVPKMINAKKTQVLYTKNVTIVEAQKLADFLIESDFANDKNPKTIELDKANNAYLFRMVVYEGAEKEEDNIATLGLFAKEISKNVFDNKNVILHMCDDNMRTLKVVE